MNPFSKASETDNEENWLSFSSFHLWFTFKMTRHHAQGILRGPLAPRSAFYKTKSCSLEKHLTGSHTLCFSGG